MLGEGFEVQALSQVNRLEPQLLSGPKAPEPESQKCQHEEFKGLGFRV